MDLLKAGSATTEWPGPDPQSTFTPHLLSLGIHFQRPAAHSQLYLRAFLNLFLSPPPPGGLGEGPDSRFPTESGVLGWIRCFLFYVSFYDSLLAPIGPYWADYVQLGIDEQQLTLGRRSRHLDTSLNPIRPPK